LAESTLTAAKVRLSRQPGPARWLNLLGVLPLFGYVAVFLGAPTVVLLVGAFRDSTAAGHWTTLSPR